MKKQLSLLAVAVALVGIAPAYAETNWGSRAGSSVDLSSAPATRTRQNVNYEKYQTRSNTSTYEVRDGKNMYYTQPSSRSAMYKQYASNNSSSTQTVRTSRSETVRTELKRKYYLAHPFYQPLKGKFGSITDLSYNSNTYDFSVSGTGWALDGTNADWKTGQFAIKEDFSFGITDKVALVGMLRYDISDYKLHWDYDDSEDKEDESGLNLFGLGAQFRVIDTADWIGELSAYYEHQKDVANDFLLEFKAGYKVSRSTIYGLVRGWYINLTDGDGYGNEVEADNPERSVFIAYNNKDNAFYIEGGLGVFSVLDEDWTLNVEGIFGHYDWHNQFSIKGEIGWQPNDWFSLNLYARASLFDSADDKKLDMFWYQPSASLPDRYGDPVGKVTLDNYQEWSIGTRIIFQF